MFSPPHPPLAIGERVKFVVEPTIVVRAIDGGDGHVAVDLEFHDRGGDGVTVPVSLIIASRFLIGFARENRPSCE